VVGGGCSRVVDASAGGASCFPVKTEGMFLSIPFTHHKALKELQKKIDRINKLLQESNQSHLAQ